MNLAEIGDKTIALAEKSGATQAEVYAAQAKIVSTYIDDALPKIGGTVFEFGIGLKYIIGRRIGFTSSTLAQETPQDVVERAKSLASVSNEDVKFVSLPEPKKVSDSPKKFYDADSAAADSPYLLEKAMEVVKGALANNVTVPNGSLRTSSIEYHIKNSLGVDAGSKGTVTFGFFTAKSTNGNTVGEGVQRCWGRQIEAIDFHAIGEKMKSQALSVIKAKAFKENWRDAAAVLAPSEGSEMIDGLVAFAASGENVNRRASPWTDKVGEKLASENLTIVDNGLSDRGLLSGVVDDEGVPTQKTTILEKGVLQSYLYDSYNANQLELASTGNGMRRTARELAGRFSIPSACAGTTMEVKPGSRSVDDIIGEIKQGLYIEHFAYPLVNPLSGTFSNEIRNARIIKKGELGEPIKHALWVGNLYESIKGNLLIASDPEVHDKRVVPTIAFPNTEIVGQ
jgi:PmbA protein